MKISAIPSGRTNNNNNNNTKNKLNEVPSNFPSDLVLGQPKHKNFANVMQKKRHESSSNTSFCSDCSDSESDSSAMCLNNAQLRTKKSIKQRNSNDGKMNVNKGKPSTPNGHKQNETSSDDTSSDSSDDDENSSDSETISNRLSKSKDSKNKTKPIEYKNNEMKLPISKNSRAEILGADCPSSSDMELPALVNAAIQRVESCSDGESSSKAVKTHYTSSLLRDFVAKTHMIGSKVSETGTSNDKQKNSNTTESKTQQLGTKNHDKEPTKKKRGRPRKNPVLNVDVAIGKTSESPDSGITSTPHSPVPNGEVPSIARRLGRPGTITKAAMKQQEPLPKKLDLARLEKFMYATERVLYPPRRQKRAESKLQSSKSMADLRQIDNDHVDPAWRKIDITKKFRRPSTCGYKSDGGGKICSKVLAAQSGYISDYGSVSHRHLSGYKSDYSSKGRKGGYRSDYSCKSRSRCGYRSDYSVGGKSQGYRSDCSVRSRRRVRRKRRTKTMPSNKTSSTVNDLDILQLAGLSLGQSEESSRDSNDKAPEPPIRKISNNRKTSSSSFQRQREISRSTNAIDGFGLKSKFSDSTNAINADVYKEIRAKKAIKLESMKAGQIRKRRSSAVSHCSSRCSTIGSRHPLNRRRRRKLKSRTDLSEPYLAKLKAQIEALSLSFLSQCAIFAEKTTKESTTTSNKGSGSKRGQKKRKGTAENSETTSTGTPSTTKRRHKKAVQTKSPDDHKLPLKKRHYLLTQEKNEQKAANDDKRKDDEIAEDKSNETVKSDKVVTPKKRHFQESPNDKQNSENSKSENASAKDLSHEISTTTKTSTTSRKTETSRKKNRSDNSNTKSLSSTSSSNTIHLQSSTVSDTTAKSQISRTSNVRTTTHEPPPGVFVPTVDLELHIPFTSISTSLPTPKITDKIMENSNQIEKVVEKLLNRTGGHLIMKRKRKKPNRTGFPTLKKKKKKLVIEIVPDVQKQTNEHSKVDEKNIVNDKIVENKIECDRVPSEGEPTDTFIRRDSQTRPVISLERSSSKLDDTLKSNDLNINKRTRETSDDKSSSRKKHKNDRIVALEKEKCELSSDNEPLINLIGKKRNQSSTAVKEKIQLPLKTDDKKKSSTDTKRDLKRAKSVDRDENVKVNLIKRRRESICVSRIKRSRAYATDIENYPDSLERDILKKSLRNEISTKSKSNDKNCTKSKEHTSKQLSKENKLSKNGKQINKIYNYIMISFVHS